MSATWSHAQQLELRDLRQELLDAWIADGPGIRRRARLFTAWLQRADITGALHVDWPYDFPQRPPLQDEQRLAVLRRLLHDHEPACASDSPAACCCSTPSH